MTKQYAEPPLQPAKYARNGTYPDAVLQGGIAELVNHIALFRLKEIASFGMTADVRSGLTPDVDYPRWRTRYRPSPYATAVVAIAWMARSTLENPTNAPYAKITILDSVGGAGGEGRASYGAATVEADDPEDCRMVTVLLAGTADPTQPFAPDQTLTYDVTISDRQSRIAAISIYELALNAETPVDEGFAVGTPILDSDREDPLTAARLMWKRQAAPLFHWTVDDQSAPRTSSSGTVLNLIDDTSTSVSAATPGYTLDLRNRSTVSRVTVPVVMSVYASATDVSQVYLYDSTGAIVGDVDITSATAAWHTVSFNLPATFAKYDIAYTGPFGETVAVYAVSLMQYETGT